MMATSGNSRKPEVAVVLAGGFGTRLRSALAGKPKVLAPVAGHPFLGYLLKYISGQGISKVILSTGYLANQVRAFAGNGAHWGLETKYIEEPSPLGTGGALRLASEGVAGPFFALNGDTLFLVDFEKLWNYHRACDAAATLTLVQSHDQEARGNVQLAKNGMITRFEEKPPEAFARDNDLVSGGIYVLTQEALADIPPGENVSIERQVFPRLAEQGKLAGFVQDAYFADIGTPESLLDFERDMMEGKVPL